MPNPDGTPQVRELAAYSYSQPNPPSPAELLEISQRITAIYRRLMAKNLTVPVPADVPLLIEAKEPRDVEA